MTPSLYARVAALARAFAMGSLDVESLVERGAAATGEVPRSIRPLARQVSLAFSNSTRPRARDIVAFLSKDHDWLLQQLGTQPSARRRRANAWLTGTPAMLPVAAGTAWNLPTLTTTAALADWLELTSDELAWHSNCAGIGQDDVSASRHHYHYLLRAKPHEGIRVLEAPQAHLKAIQRRILIEILDRIPPYFTAAHGFVKGRSVRTFAAEHVGRSVVLRMDLADFFPRISGARVQAVFRTMGYPEAVADALGGLCTNATPAGVFAQSRWPALRGSDLRDGRRLYARPHLPQGAPTSPALANLCAYRLDCRLTGLADWAGAVYSRYADDLAFSGDDDVARRIERYAAEIGAIALEEGWSVHHRKTRIMRRSAQQRLTGLVVNARVSIPRREIDTLRAILTNCVRHGPASQNRERRPDFRAHLAGRIAWVQSVNASQSARLQCLFDQIDWAL
jgi:RNA-directed DNA polymerase